LAGKNQVPGLADEHGCLPDNVDLVVKNASADDVELEIRAQIDRAETMGFPITHMDSHMGTLFRPEFIERYVKVGIEKQIPILMVPQAGKVAQKVWDGGLPVLDHIHGDSYDWKTLDLDEKVGLYVDSIRNLKPGITYMIIHCTKPNDMIGIINGNRDFLYGDYLAMIDPRTKKAIEEEGIILTTMKELKARRDKVGKKKRL
jgi:chitin disaccharide deacetylase